FRPLAVLLTETGMRIGEALGLRWRDVNLEDQWKLPEEAGGNPIPPNAIAVNGAFVRGEYTTTKTRKTRIIPLTSSAWVALALHREREGSRVFAAPKPTSR